MNTDTPKKKKIRERLVKKFSEDWEIDTKTIPTIRYKKKPGLRGIYQNIFGRKHTVFAMYWFFKHERQKNEELRGFDFPIKHDNFPISGERFKYKLRGRWQIDEDDLRYLYDGPLIDQLGDLLVPVYTKLKRIRNFIQLAIQFILILSALTAIAINIPKLLEMFT